MVKYAEAFPADLAMRWQEGAPAIVPWGALEWHGNHLPLGVDGILAEGFAVALAQRLNGVLLPTVWMPITTLPGPSSLQVRTETLRLVLDDTLSSLYGTGARRVLLVTGHYAQGHLVEFVEAALRAMEDHADFFVFTGAPLQPLGRPEVLDHAAASETAQLLATRPDLVRLDALPDQISPHAHAVLGEDPRQATAEVGQELVDQGLRAWETWLDHATIDSLTEDYKRVFDELQPYVDAFYEGSWDEALMAWWKTKGENAPM